MNKPSNNDEDKKAVVEALKYLSNVFAQKFKMAEMIRTNNMSALSNEASIVIILDTLAWAIENDQILPVFKTIMSHRLSTDKVYADNVEKVALECFGQSLNDIFSYTTDDSFLASLGIKDNKEN